MSCLPVGAVTARKVLARHSPPSNHCSSPSPRPKLGRHPNTRKEVRMLSLLPFSVPQAPPPWYTVAALLLLAIMILGAYVSVARLLWRALGGVFGLPWLALNSGWSLVFGRPLISHGTAHWIHRRELARLTTAV